MSFKHSYIPIFFNAIIIFNIFLRSVIKIKSRSVQFNSGSYFLGMVVIFLDFILLQVFTFGA